MNRQAASAEIGPKYRKIYFKMPGQLIRLAVSIVVALVSLRFLMLAWIDESNNYLTNIFRIVTTNEVYAWLLLVVLLTAVFLLCWFGLVFRRPQAWLSGMGLIFSMSGIARLLFWADGWYADHWKSQWFSNWIISWLSLTLFFIFLISFFIWLFIDRQHDPQNFSNMLTPNVKIRDIHVSRYGNLHAEVTRYRDLSWKIVASAWAIYLALVAYGDTWVDPVTIRHSPLKLPAVLAFLTAFIATVFVLFCEYSANRNRLQRRAMEILLSLELSFRHGPRGEELTRPGFWFSVGSFLLTIWAPPLILLLLKM